MMGSGIDKLRLRLIRFDQLEAGLRLPGHLRDRQGRILIKSGQVLTAQALDRLSRRHGNLYVGPDWGRPTKPARTSRRAAGEPNPIHARIIEALRQQEEIHQWSERRGSERYTWNTEIAIAVEENDGMRVCERSVRVSTQDISVKGFGFVYEQFLNPGTVVRACFEHVPGQPILTGVVRNGKHIRGTLHRIGVEFFDEGAAEAA
jgi:hypothetical protein